VIRVRIPPTLRSEVGGAREVEATGSTLREVLADLAERFPGLGQQVLEDGDDIAPFVNVYLNSEDVRTLDGLDTEVRSDSTVILLPAMAGRWSSSPAWPRTRVCGSTRSSRARTRPARSRIASPRR
jgi:molybdopterin synthase sulfur carrier subunit